jgi:hypothetical protein
VAVACIPEEARTQIKYPHEVSTVGLLSDAEVAKVPFASKSKAKQVAADRARVSDANPDHVQRNLQGADVYEFSGTRVH